MFAPDRLVGEWTIERELTDRLAGMTGRFAGSLVVAPDVDGYRWSESGTLRWGEYTGPAERELLLRRIDGEWWMCFADGRRFHPWRPDTELVHPCRADLYRGRIEPGGPDEFTLTWDVRGPAKRQLIVSRMRRQPSEAPAAAAQLARRAPRPSPSAPCTTAEQAATLRRERIGYLSQHSTLELGLALRGVDRSRVREQAATWLARVGLPGYAGRRAADTILRIEGHTPNHQRTLPGEEDKPVP